MGKVRQEESEGKERGGVDYFAGNMPNTELPTDLLCDLIGWEALYNTTA